MCTVVTWFIMIKHKILRSLNCLTFNANSGDNFNRKKKLHLELEVKLSVQECSPTPPCSQLSSFPLKTWGVIGFFQGGFQLTSTRSIHRTCCGSWNDNSLVPTRFKCEDMQGRCLSCLWSNWCEQEWHKNLQSNQRTIIIVAFLVSFYGWCIILLYK